MKTKLTITICALVGALILFSCENPVALGKKLNMDPPIVTIETPDFMENISGGFEITGTATDLEEIVVISVSLEKVGESGTAWKREWRAERGRWMARSNASESWNPEPEEGDWKQQGGKNNILWSVQTSMDGAPDGEYLITAGAKNNVENEGSLIQRRVVIDNEGPLVKLFTPDLEANRFNVVEPIFDEYQLRDQAILDRLHSKSIRIQYEVTDAFSFTSLTFQLADRTGDIIYYEGEVEYPNWSGKVDILAEDIINPDTGLEFDINDPSDKAYMQIISIAKDKAKNERKQRRHGWLVWWPASDKPWVEGIGDESNPYAFPVFAKTEVQGQAYDNDGLAQVSYRIYEGHGINESKALSEVTVLTNPPLVEGGAPSAFFAWSFTAPDFCTDYTIEMDCVDMYGVNGIKSIRYFYVMDTEKPSVSITTPRSEITMFGDINGDVVIEGYAEDGFDPTGLKMVWINPKGIDPTESRINYRSQEYAGWLSATAGGFEDPYYKNKTWVLDLIDPKVSNPNGNGRFYKEFTKTINLFTDLGIGSGIPLTTQYFIFWIEGTSATNVKSAATHMHTVRGDVEQPKLTITEITLKRSGDPDTVYTIDENGDLFEGTEPRPAMKVMEPNDTITLSGIWSDDSWAHWGTPTGENRMGNLEITWNGKPITGGGLSYATPAPNSTWTKGPFTIDGDEALKGGGFIQASLFDLTGNRGYLSLTVKVSTNVPVLLYATSEKDDGSYRSGTAIPIALEFNTQVTFFGTTLPSTPPPVLNMTVGGSPAGTATWDSTSDGTATHIFNYTAGSLTTLPPGELLSIGSINMNGGTWRAEAGGPAAVPAFQTGRNLGDMKKIIIDNSPPIITKIESSTGVSGVDNYYKAGATIYLRVEFNEEITFVDAGSLSVVINSTTTQVTNPVPIGNNALLFTYTVASGHNTPAATSLRVTDISGLSSITDIAGNTLDTADTTYTNINAGAGAKTIYVDTTPPARPTINNITTGSFSVPQSFTISGIETGGRAEYRISTNGGWASWISYESAPPPIANPGTYIIQARQFDRAENVSTSAESATFTIYSFDPLLVSFGGSPSGTYGAGKVIDIVLNMRESITVGGTMTLTLTSGHTANFVSSSNGTSALLFHFTTTTNTPAGAYVNITSINMTGVTLTGANSSNVTNQLTDDNRAGKIPAALGDRQLDYYTKIAIDTSVPILTSTALNGTDLTLSFSKEIFKGTGNINLTIPEANYRAPAVLTRNEYLRYNNGNALAAYYTAGTNGTDATGNADTSEKYILNWEINPTDATGTAVKMALINAGANKVEVAVVSGAVKKGTGTANNTLVIDLSTAYGYVLPVKGVSYTLTFPNTLVQDNLNNSLTAAGNTTVLNPGVNQPFVRIQRNRGTVTNESSESQQVAVGPPTTKTFWIRNADISMTEQTGSNWAFATGFYLTTTTTVSQGYQWPVGAISIDAPTTNSTFFVNIQRNTNATVQGEVFSQGTGTGNTIPYAISYWVDGWDRKGNINFYVNPYVNDAIATLGDRTQGGDIRFDGNKGFWVNLNTAGATIVEQTTSPGNGYIPVTQTEQEYTIRDVYVISSTQPTSAQVVIDCQTPGSIIAYTVNDQATVPVTGTGNGDQRFNGTTRPARPTVTMPTSSTTSYTGYFTLGGETNMNGYLYGIRATATAGGQTATAYDKAARSVIQFTGMIPTGANNIVNWGNLGTQATNMGRSLQLWLRGGDQASGANLTPGFPLGWDETDWEGAIAGNPSARTSGARLMTRQGDTGDAANNWYWITWEVSARPAYFHFIAGTTSSAEETARGPWNWSWGKNDWAFQHDKYPLYPGGSLSFSRDTNTTSDATSTFEFYDSFGGNR